MLPQLYYCPHKVRYTTHHDVGGYDLRIHTDGLHKKSLQQGPGQVGEKEPETLSGPWVWLQGAPYPTEGHVDPRAFFLG